MSSGSLLLRYAMAVQDESTRKPEMKLTVPEPLKVLLVDDWEAVTKNSQVCTVLQLSSAPRSTSLIHVQLVGLPRKPNVVELLDEFKNYVLSQASSLQYVYLGFF